MYSLIVWLLLSAIMVGYMIYSKTSYCRKRGVTPQPPTENNSTVDDSDIPQDWQPQTKDSELFPVRKGCSEWDRVAQRFKASLPNASIQQITRIQNKWLWGKYINHKKRLGRKNNGLVNEKELFHGTSRNDPKLIYDGEDGFDMRFSAQGMWGQANYFAVNASYSDNNYAYRRSGGLKELFLAKVLTGDSYECASNTSLRIPPEKQGGIMSTLQRNFARTRYDTVTGTTAGSRVYMTYDNEKAYPAYLIQYK